MNWISNYVRPKINSLFSKHDTPDNLWTKCPECGTMLFHRELTENMNVCTNCDHHMHITPRARFSAMFDGGIFSEVKVPEPIEDPLKFRDQKKYPDRMKAAQKSTGEKEAMLVAEGEIGRTPVVAAAQDFSFMGGSMGMYVGNAFIAGVERAIELKRPFIMFSAAGGARMQEGILSLMQMPRTTVAIEMLKEAGLPYIVVLTHPTTGGVTASYAMLGDIHIAEPNALICFAGPRVIEQTIREKLPEGFQRAEYLLDHGMLDRVTDRRKMKDELVTILRMLGDMSPAVAGDLPAPEPAPEAEPEAASDDITDSPAAGDIPPAEDAKK
ncbi:acetyl-CoA carboxylase, carboxyltransferase subunit beta [Celeribacter sp.]|uniref:acetyl-CoA carboxylase, carboxyltransferase subunit beta n=1 Tax=Celeribacter sp. TaxID=1890673 RepID=UPI003A8D80CF